LIDGPERVAVRWEVANITLAEWPHVAGVAGPCQWSGPAPVAWPAATLGSGRHLAGRMAPHMGNVAGRSAGPFSSRGAVPMAWPAAALGSSVTGIYLAGWPVFNG